MTVKLVEEIDDEETRRARLILHAVEPHQDGRPEVPSIPTKPPPPTRDFSEGLVEVMGLLARIMGFRIQLFVGFLGALGLGSYAAYTGTAMSLTAAGMFYLLVFLPVVWLAYKKG